MKNCPVCGAPVADDVPQCFKCGSDMSSTSKSIPSLMARFKREADLKAVKELDENELETDPDLSAPRQTRNRSSVKTRASPSPKVGPVMDKKPRKPVRKTPASTKPPLTSRASAEREALEDAEPVIDPELMGIMGSPKQELAQASRIYAELLSRGGMGPETMKRLENVMDKMGADTDRLRAKFGQPEPEAQTIPSTSPIKGSKATMKKPGTSQASTKAKAKTKGKVKPKPGSPINEQVLQELPSKTGAVPKTKAKTKGKAKDKAKTRARSVAKGKDQDAGKVLSKPELPTKTGTDTDGAEELANSHCRVCGKEAEPEWTHCPWCGGELPPHCPSCQREMAPDWRFCPYCGFDDRG